MDEIRFGPDREPRRWLPSPRWPDWCGRSGGFRGRATLVIAVAVVAATAGVLVATREQAGRRPSLGLPRLAAQPPVLFGVRARSIRTDLVIGGDYFWKLESGYPRQVLAGVLANGASPLLANQDAGVSQIGPAAGGVVAVINYTPVPGLARGVVVFVPGRGAARVIARASAAAVAHGGRRVWVQTAVRPQSGWYTARRKSVWSPTYAVSLAGQRVSPVLRLPLGLIAATGTGLLIDDVQTNRLELWNAVTGRPQRLLVPGSAQVAAAGQGTVIWQPQSCPARCPLHLTDLRTGAGVTILVPAGWGPMQNAEPVASDRSGTRFVIALARVDAAGDLTAEDLYLIDATTRSARAIPGGPSASDQPLGLANPGVQITGAWDQRGLLWVLATSGYGFFQLGYWTGTGPLHVYRPILGDPAALAAPGT